MCSLGRIRDGFQAEAGRAEVAVWAEPENKNTGARLAGAGM